MHTHILKNNPQLDLTSTCTHVCSQVRDGGQALGVAGQTSVGVHGQVQQVLVLAESARNYPRQLVDREVQCFQAGQQSHRSGNAAPQLIVSEVQVRQC